jgi:ATP-dependent Clp protease ATP-binding subunit ClpB
MIKQLGQASSVPINERVPSYDSDSAKERSAALSSFAVDLVELARLGRLDPVIGRDAEITRVLQVLSRRTKNNVCLVGAPGVGKTAVAEAVAQRIAAGHVPHQLRNCKELWSLDIGALIAGTGLRGDFEERLKVVLSVLRASGGEAMLFIDELHLVLGAGRSENNNVDAANLMKPLLARGEIRCIGATTNNEYRSLILEKDAAFERRFQPIELEEPKPEVAEEMLRGLSNLYAQHHEITVAPSTLKAAVHLSIRHIKGRSLPDKAIDVLDEACCLAACEGATSVEERHVQTVISRWKPPPWQRDAGPLHRSFAWVQQQWSRL